MEYVLTTDALTKTYRHSRAVDGVSVHVARGEIYGFVGRISAMRRLTEELLAYSVAASDETEPVLAEVDVAAALEDSLTQFYAAFEERGISPSIDIPQNEVVRIADKDALARVFGNVISNIQCGALLRRRLLRHDEGKRTPSKTRRPRSTR